MKKKQFRAKGAKQAKKVKKVPAFAAWAERAFRRVARNLLAESRASVTPIVVWKNGKVAKERA